MSLPKFNLSKLKESVAKQQAVTKEDIRNLLLLDRLQAQVASQNSLARSGFTIKGKRLTKKDKVNLKENPDAAIYNAFIDSIVEGIDFEMDFNVVNDSPNENQILKGADFGDSFRFFEEKLMENFSQYYLIDDGYYHENILYINPANDRMITVELNQDSGGMNIFASKLNTDAFYSLDNPTFKNTIDTIFNAFKTEKAREAFFTDIGKKFFVCKAYFGFDNWQTLLFFPYFQHSEVYDFYIIKSELKYEFKFLDEKSFEDLENGLTKLINQFSPRVVHARDIVNIERFSDVITKI